ncbi:MAG: RagB/SusD family nutrient uptake outer membrane protein [Adhaeribacter sp.]
MKKRVIYIASLCFTLLALPGCKDFLQEVPLDAPSDATFLKNEAEINFSLNSLYRSMATDFQPVEPITDGWTDIGIQRAPELGEGNFDTYNTSVRSLWSSNYISIQRANNLLAGMTKAKDQVAPATYNRLEAEARVLRALAYQRLVFLFGDVPLITRPLLPEEFKTQTRAPKAEVVQFLYDELDAAAANLGWTYTQRGRVSKAVALGLKARIALYNKDYATAAASAKLVIDGAGLSLNPRFQDLFTRSGQKPNAGGEIMYEILYSDALTTARTNIALGAASRTAGAQSGRFPTQNLVDMFEARDGKRIDESSVYDPANPRVNRDRRLKYTVAMPGDTVSMNLKTFIYDIYNNKTMVRAANGTWSLQANADFDNQFGPAKSGVGYLWSKYVMTDEDNFATKVSFIMMRYAEILLTYAEAKIELNEIDASVITAINQVRQRAGQPALVSAISDDQVKLRQLIRRERTVELAYEGFRWYDIRRWDIAELVMPGKVTGIAKLNVTDPPTALPPVPNFKTSPVHDLNNIPVYTNQLDLRLTREMRFWYPKLMLLPIPQADRDITPSLSQNTGW